MEKVVDATIKVHGRNLVLMNSYCDDSLRNTGELASNKKYSIMSSCAPCLGPSILWLPGSEPKYDDMIVACLTESHQEALEARDALMGLLDQINAEHIELIGIDYLDSFTGMLTILKFKNWIITQQPKGPYSRQWLATNVDDGTTQIIFRCDLLGPFNAISADTCKVLFSNETE